MEIKNLEKVKKINLFLLILSLFLSLLLIGEIFILIFFFLIKKNIQFSNISNRKNVVLESRKIPSKNIPTLKREKSSFPFLISETPKITKHNFVLPFSLPPDCPFKMDEIEKLAEEADEKYYIYYHPKGEFSLERQEEFKKKIEPYIKVYLAAVEYSFKKNKPLLTTPESDDSYTKRNSLTLHVYETCEQILTERKERCKNRRMIAFTNPFNFATKLYINLDYVKDNFFPISLISTGMHETVHILQYTYSKKGRGASAPDWYKEGMAEALSFRPFLKKEMYPHLFLNYQYPSSFKEFEQMFNEDTSTEEALNNLRRAYVIATEFYFYLVNKTDQKKYHSLLIEKYGGLNSAFDEKFIQIFGKTKEEMYEEFLKNKKNF